MSTCNDNSTFVWNNIIPVIIHENDYNGSESNGQPYYNNNNQYYDSIVMDDDGLDSRESREDCRLIVDDVDSESNNTTKVDQLLLSLISIVKDPEYRYLRKKFWKYSCILNYSIITIYCCVYYYLWNLFTSVESTDFVGDKKLTYIKKFVEFIFYIIYKFLLWYGILTSQAPILDEKVSLDLIKSLSFKNPILYLILFPLMFKLGMYAYKKRILPKDSSVVCMVWFIIKFLCCIDLFVEYQDVLLGTIMISPLFGFVQGYFYDKVLTEDWPITIAWSVFLNLWFCIQFKLDVLVLSAKGTNAKIFMFYPNIITYIPLITMFMYGLECKKMRILL